MTFDEIMELTPANKKNYRALVVALNRQTIIPFIGAGMSVPFYPLWDAALEELKKLAAPDRFSQIETEYKDAKTEIDRCEVLEDALGKNILCRGLCELFDISKYSNAKDLRPTEKVDILPWLFRDSPIITTNMDRMLEEVYRNQKAPFLESLNPTDKNILPVLRQQRAHGILYLHGWVSGELTDYDKLVFSKTQYKNHYSSDGNLISELQHWMSGAQLLFMGCSLRNDRTLDILNNINKAIKNIQHFAIIDLKADKDVDITSRMIQLEKDYGIRAIIYKEGQHDSVEIILKRLLQDVNPTSWEDYQTAKEKTQELGKDEVILLEKSITHGDIIVMTSQYVLDKKDLIDTIVFNIQKGVHYKYVLPGDRMREDDRQKAIKKFENVCKKWWCRFQQQLFDVSLFPQMENTLSDEYLALKNQINTCSNMDKKQYIIKAKAYFLKHVEAFMPGGVRDFFTYVLYPTNSSEEDQYLVLNELSTSPYKASIQTDVEMNKKTIEAAKDYCSAKNRIDVLTDECELI